MTRPDDALENIFINVESHTILQSKSKHIQIIWAMAASSLIRYYKRWLRTIFLFVYEFPTMKSIIMQFVAAINLICIN